MCQVCWQEELEKQSSAVWLWYNLIYVSCSWSSAVNYFMPTQFIAECSDGLVPFVCGGNKHTYLCKLRIIRLCLCSTLSELRVSVSCVQTPDMSSLRFACHRPRSHPDALLCASVNVCRLLCLARPAARHRPNPVSSTLITWFLHNGLAGRNESLCLPPRKCLPALTRL